MPIYEYDCPQCGAYIAPIVPMIERDKPRVCTACGHPMKRRVSGPYGRVRGRADGKIIGGPDQFTADVLGYKVKDLPEPLKANPKRAA